MCGVEWRAHRSWLSDVPSLHYCWEFKSTIHPKFKLHPFTCSPRSRVRLPALGGEKIPPLSVHVLSSKCTCDLAVQFVSRLDICYASLLLYLLSVGALGHNRPSLNLLQSQAGGDTQTTSTLEWDKLWKCNRPFNFCTIYKAVRRCTCLLTWSFSTRPSKQTITRFYCMQEWKHTFHQSSDAQMDCVLKGRGGYIFLITCRLKRQTDNVKISWIAFPLLSVSSAVIEILFDNCWDKKKCYRMYSVLQKAKNAAVNVPFGHLIFQCVFCKSISNNGTWLA